MNSVVQEGQMQVIAIVVAIIATSLIGRVIQRFLDSNLSAGEIVLSNIYAVLTVVLCYFLYQGHLWAKWAIGILLGMAGFITFPIAAIALRSTLMGPASLLIQSTIYLAASWVLLRSPEITAFLLSQHRG